MDLEDKIARSIKEDLVDSSDFDRFFTFEQSLGEGSGGEVSAFRHRPTKRLIAVKVPHPDRISASILITKEAKALKAVGSHGQHENINHMISYQSTYGTTLCPAIFLDIAEFGSLWAYRRAWCKQEAANRAPTDIPEATVWKLFKDVTLALDFLRNNCRFIHRDVKTEYILVNRSPTAYGSVVPKVPVFKLADFSRAVAYPSLDFGGQYTDGLAPWIMHFHWQSVKRTRVHVPRVTHGPLVLHYRSSLSVHSQFSRERRSLNR